MIIVANGEVEDMVQFAMDLGFLMEGKFLGGEQSNASTSLNGLNQFFH